MQTKRISLSFAFLFAVLAGTPVAHAASTCLANAPVSTPTSDFTLNGNGTVTHLKTGLMWKQCLEGRWGESCAGGGPAFTSWSQAQNTTATPFAGYNDWRLPNKKELQSIVETACASPSVNETVFPNTAVGDTWTSTIYAFPPPPNFRWMVEFSNGASSVNGGGGGNGVVRLVRGGQPMDSYPVLLKTNQTITFGTAPTLVFGGTGVVSASGGASGNAVTFTSATTGVCTISGGVVTAVTVGTCTIAADQAGNASYNAAPQATQTFGVAKAGQTIAFGAAPAVVVGGTGTVSASGGASGNAVTFTSATTGVCTVSGSTVTGVATGTCTIAADQAGNGNYNAAAQATQSFNVGSAGPASQTISFGAAPTVIVGGTGTVSATGGASGNAVTFTSSTTGVCTISGSVVTAVTGGTCTIAANQAGNGSYNAAPQVMQSFSVGLGNQAISFGVAPTVIVGGTGTVSATGGASGNAVTFTSATSGVCTISGSIVTGVTAGTCTIAANQAGNGSYNAAPQLTQSFNVGMGSQTIAFGVAPTVIVGGTGTLSATAGASGNVVTYSSSTPGVCTVSGSTVTGVTAGICTIVANLAGNGSYGAAPQATLTFAIVLQGVVAAIPTLSEWGVILLAGMLGLFGMGVIRRRSVLGR